MSKQLERLNFFPEADAFFTARYSYQRLNIETPQQTLMTKEVNNYLNVVALTYAHRLSRKMFIGVNGYLEEASENGVKYGVPFRRRFNASGAREPEIFMLYRLRFQKEKRGMIDFFLSHSPTFGRRQVGVKEGNRYNGMPILKTGLSHGLHEEDWEFKSALSLNYFAKGEEWNGFTNSVYDLGAYKSIKFQFSAQYQANEWLLPFGSVGVVYTGPEIIKEGQISREIQTGTGSVFEVGLKRPLGERSLVEVSFSLERYEYFVKSNIENLDGEVIEQQLSLAYKTAF
ncbi:MAG TPA: hypothetical protein VNJ08_07615 [Bacteriovoracaceae bacterium]|nr:hypothetical protein [Bacteriovoracaceae bacterium]